MSSSNLKHTAELAYEKDNKQYVLFCPSKDKKNPDDIDSIFLNSLEELKPVVKDYGLETIICYENEETGLSPEDISKLTKLLIGKKKEKICCEVLKESDPAASVPYNASNVFSD